MVKNTRSVLVKLTSHKHNVSERAENCLTESHVCLYSQAQVPCWKMVSAGHIQPLHLRVSNLSFLIEANGRLRCCYVQNVCHSPLLLCPVS